MDDSFFSFSQIIEKLLSVEGEIYDDENGVHSYIKRFEVGTPVELDVYRDEEGKLKLGSMPPLYRVSTSFRPSYHSITFIAEKTPDNNGD